MNVTNPAQEINQQGHTITELLDHMYRNIVGQKAFINPQLIGLIADGHLFLEVEKD